MKIIDRLNPNPPTKPKPIKLIGCLQSSLSDEDSFSFGHGAIRDKKDWGPVLGITEIERVHTQTISGFTWDFMIVRRAGNYAPCLFIGKWNDGVWED